MNARVRALIAMSSVVAGTVGGGTLQCDPITRSPVEAHGAEVYGRMCAVCHGASAEGYKADEATALGHPDFLASVTDEYLRSAISNGRDGTTMSAWGIERGGPLARSDVNAVIAYLRSLGDGRHVTLDERPLAGDATRGERTFAEECARCHGTRGTGGPNVNIGNPQLLLTASNGFLRYAIAHGRRPTVMPAFGANPAYVEDSVALLRTFQAAGTTAAARRAAPAKPPPIPLGPVPLNPGGRDPTDFTPTPGYTKADVVAADLRRGAKMAILDARAPSDYTGEHIAGAVSVPFYDPDPYVSALPRDAWIVCYCGCPHAESSQLAQKLRAKGFTKVTVIDEGLRYWKKKEYATRVGLLP